MVFVWFKDVKFGVFIYWGLYLIFVFVFLCEVLVVESFDFVSGFKFNLYVEWYFNIM